MDTTLNDLGGKALVEITFLEDLYFFLLNTIDPWNYRGGQKDSIVKKIKDILSEHIADFGSKEYFKRKKKNAN